METWHSIVRCTVIGVSTAVLGGGISPASAQQPRKDAGEIIVTGTRIVQQDLDTPNPTVTISAESIQLSGSTNLTNMLMNQPALVGSLDSAQTTGSAGFIGSGGLNLLNLRNLGTDRTLVLVNGRRHVASLPETASVDINTIPSDLIERIDIATGGVSAVYGADAVSGVVNFIMKTDFEGITTRAQYGAGDGGKPVDWNAGVTAGTNFAGGRGNIAGAIEYTREGRLQGKDRSYLRGSNYRALLENVDDPDDDPALPDRVPYNDVRYYDTARQGAIDIDFDGLPEFLPDGSPFVNPLEIPPFYAQGGSGTLVSDYIGDVLAKNETTVVSAFAHYDLTDHAELFGEVKYARGESFNVSQPTFDYYLFLSEENPYLSPAIQQAIVDADLGNGGVLLNRDNFDLGVRGEDNTRDTWRTVAGVRGDLTENMQYELSYVYGQTKVKNVSTSNRYNDRLFAALDVVNDPDSGDPVCRSNLDPDAIPDQPYQDFVIGDFWPDSLSFTPGPNSGCLPLNLLGDGVASPAAIDWVMTNSLATSRITQNVVTGFIRGNVPGIELPGGKLSYATGLEWRRETSRSTPPAEDQAGLTFGNVILPTDGHFDVKEAFAEIVAPLLKDRPWAEELEFTGALRLSDYSTVGSTTTWNLGARWAPVADVTFRGTLAEAVRAPNIGELFGPQSQTFEFIDDPCATDSQNNGSQYRAANCAEILTALGQEPDDFDDPNSSSISGLSSGNDALSEETAHTWTAGVVLRPRFAENLAVSVDFYDIKIKQAISQAEAQQVADNCVDQPTLDNVFCDALTRDPVTAAIDSFRVRPENVSEFRTQGVDFTIDYVLDPATMGAKSNWGTFTFTLVGNHLDKLTFIPTPGADVDDDRTEQYAPEWQSNFDIIWQRGPVMVNYGFSYWSETKRYSNATLAGDPDHASADNIDYDAREVHDLQVAYDFNEQTRLYTGINNLTNEKPDFDTYYPSGVQGRVLYAGFRASFGTE